MQHCTNCGAALADDSAFCGACGVPAGAHVAAAATSSGTSASSSARVGLSMNLAAALSYALGLITGILFLVLEPYKNNRLVRFHAMQSVIFSVACIAFAIVWSIGVGILVSVMGYWVLTIDVPLRLLVGLGIFLYWLYVMFQAYSEREYRIPWIGDIAAKQVH
jgi:uncharacterized membrane protein